MSNILSVFNPPPPRKLSDEEVGHGCLPCTAMQSLFLFAGGIYLTSNYVFKDFKTGKIDYAKNPMWWQKTVKGAGVVIFGLGAYRAGEVAQMLLKPRLE